ncbi:hypothetical protein HPO96_37215 [Kribbella sandramycini]|uniref:Uncharacterized protein n=1 Tax=Kribbella sandramycini TaxID=60450 RepID=A0A7Y4L9W3_9ACTN|nr:hypothetical protein [Kribbella sandramycini]MBB6564444.1 hypothetical protein [Kribbella sandramycini]NOL45901.1 hypothetical protein [Kribbella sandramycini]
MAIFLAAVAVLLIVAVTIAHDLKRRAGADTLGLKAARSRVVADMHRRVYLEKRHAMQAHINEAWHRIHVLIQSEHREAS